jgi:ribosomal protein S18 acetylase RimI-like enzyme
MKPKMELPGLSKPQLSQAIALIGRAFHDDPLSVYIYPDEAERVQRLPLMFSIPLRYTLRYGEITTTPERTGAACWLPPQHTTIRLGRLLRVGALTPWFKMRLAERRCLDNAETHMKSVHHRCITQPHWYLWVLGVDPVRQGQGIGGTLLRAGLARVDAASLPCYLETMNPENVPLYQKFGFVLESETIIPDSSVRMWNMIRPAQVHT